MKILLLANSLDNSCGVSSHLFILSRGLINSGINLVIASGGGNSIQKYRDLGVEVKIIPELLHEKRCIKNWVLAELKMFRLMKSNDFDIIHSHHHFAANIARNISRILGVRSVQTIHGILPGSGRLPRYAADYFIAVSDHILDYLVKERKIEGKKIVKIYNGASSNVVKRGIRNGKIRFLAAARMVEEKKLQDYLLAANSLQEKYYESAEFFLSGAGEYKDELIMINEQNGGKVKIINEIKELSKEYYRYDVFIHCSGVEGLPMSLLEAAFSKCMLITSNYAGLNRHYTQENGLEIYNTGDTFELKRIIEKIIENPHIIMSNAGRMYRTVNEYFKSSSMIYDTVEFYNRIKDGG